MSVSEGDSLPSIELVIFDFDGVLTDNFVYVDSAGVESVRCSRSDGLGFAALAGAGVEAVVVTNEMDPVVRARCEKLQVQAFQTMDKASTVSQLIADRGLRAEQVAYLGNDVNDLAAMASVGWPAAVADAHPDVRAVATTVTDARGGHGAAREFAEVVLRARVTSPPPRQP